MRGQPKGIYYRYGPRADRTVDELVYHDPNYPGDLNSVYGVLEGAGIIANPIRLAPGAIQELMVAEQADIGARASPYVENPYALGPMFQGMEYLGVVTDTPVIYAMPIVPGFVRAANGF